MPQQPLKPTNDSYEQSQAKLEARIQKRGMRYVKQTPKNARFDPKNPKRKLAWAPGFETAAAEVLDEDARPVGGRTNQGRMGRRKRSR